MAETILGIDLGLGEARLFRLRRGLRRVEAAGMAAGPMPLSAEPAEVARAARTLVDQNGLAADRVVLGLDSRQIMLRRLAFPFASRRKIAQVAAFELESHLPCPVTETIVDFQPSAGGRPGEHPVLAGAMRKKILGPLIEAFMKVGLDPETVTVDACGLGAAADLLTAPVARGALFAHLGPDRAVILARHDRLPLTFRSVPGPRGNDPEAPGGSADAETLSMEVLAGEMLLTLAQVGGETALAPEEVILAGLGAADPEKRRELAERLGIPVRPMADLGLPVFGVGPAAGAALDVFAVAAGLALVAARSRPALDFRSGDFAGGEAAREARRFRSVALATAGVVLAAWIGAAAADIMVKRDWLAGLRRAMTGILDQAMPDRPPGLDQAQYLSMLRGRRAEAAEAVEAAKRGRSSAGLVDILNAMSKAVPKDLPVKITGFGYDDRLVRLSGTASGYNSVETLKKRLQDSGVFSAARIGGAKARGGGTVEFDLELTVGPAREAS